jgi:hypothetical protein
MVECGFKESEVLWRRKVVDISKRNEPSVAKGIEQWISRACEILVSQNNEYGTGDRPKEFDSDGRRRRSPHKRRQGNRILVWGLC